MSNTDKVTYESLATSISNAEQEIEDCRAKHAEDGQKCHIYRIRELETTIRWWREWQRRIKLYGEDSEEETPEEELASQIVTNIRTLNIFEQFHEGTDDKDTLDNIEQDCQHIAGLEKKLATLVEARSGKMGHL